MLRAIAVPAIVVALAAAGMAAALDETVQRMLRQFSDSIAEEHGHAQAPLAALHEATAASEGRGASPGAGGQARDGRTP